MLTQLAGLHRIDSKYNELIQKLQINADEVKAFQAESELEENCQQRIKQAFIEDTNQVEVDIDGLPKVTCETTKSAEPPLCIVTEATCDSQSKTEEAHDEGALVRETFLPAHEERMLAQAQQSVIPVVLRPVLESKAAEQSRRKSGSRTRASSKQPIKKAKVITVLDESVRVQRAGDRTTIDMDKVSPNVRPLNSGFRNSILASSRKSDVKGATSRTMSQRNAPAFL